MLLYATNDVSIDALFALEVQFFVRRSGKLFKDATETVNDSQTAASDGKFSISANVHFEHEPTDVVILHKERPTVGLSPLRLYGSYTRQMRPEFRRQACALYALGRKRREA